MDGPVPEKKRAEMLKWSGPIPALLVLCSFIPVSCRQKILVGKGVQVPDPLPRGAVILLPG